MYKLPASEMMPQVLREPLREVLPADDEYQERFDEFEHLLALLQADLNSGGEGIGYFDYGRWSYRVPHFDDEWKTSRTTAARVTREVEEQGEEWPLFRAGAFQGSIERLRKVQQLVHESVRRSGIHF